MPHPTTSPTPQTQICIVQVQEKIPQSSMTYFQVDMNVITPTPPHPNPKWPRCIFYCYAHHIIHVCSSWHERYYPHPTPNDPYVYSIAGFYMHAWFYKVGMFEGHRKFEGHRNSAGCLKLLWLRSLILLSLNNPLPHCCESSTKNPMLRAWLKLICQDQSELALKAHSQCLDWFKVWKSTGNHGFFPCNISWLVVYLPLWKIWKSVGSMTFPIYGKKMFQTTNQIRVFSNLSLTPTFDTGGSVTVSPLRNRWGIWWTCNLAYPTTDLGHK